MDSLFASDWLVWFIFLEYSHCSIWSKAAGCEMRRNHPSSQSHPLKSTRPNPKPGAESQWCCPSVELIVKRPCCTLITVQGTFSCAESKGASWGLSWGHTHQNMLDRAETLIHRNVFMSKNTGTTFTLKCTSCTQVHTSTQTVEAQRWSHLRNAKYLPLLAAWMAPPIITLSLSGCPLTSHVKIPQCQVRLLWNKIQPSTVSLFLLPAKTMWLVLFSPCVHVPAALGTTTAVVLSTLAGVSASADKHCHRSDRVTNVQDRATKFYMCVVDIKMKVGFKDGCGARH